MAGRPRKPTKLHVLHGNPGKRPLPKREPQPTPGAPSRPGWLSPEAKREWNRLVRELDAMGLLAKLDRALLSTYCETWAQYVAAVKALQPKRVKGEDGEIVVTPASLTFTTDKGYVGAAPEFGIAMKAAQRLMQLSARFGFSPADRSKMALPEVEKEDPFAEFMNRGKKAANE